MTAQATLRQRLQRIVRQNLGLKLISLVVSLGLYTIVHGSAAGQRSLYVPVVALLPPEASHKVLVGEIPDKVKLTLSGSRSVLNSIDAVEAVQIDLTEAQKYYYFKPDQFGLPGGIEVQVTPATLALDWEVRLDRKLGVRVQLAFAPEPGLEVAGAPTVSPARVLVQGPQSSVEGLTELTTEPLSLSGLAVGVHRRRVPLLPLPKHVTAVDAGDITVEITLEPRRELRRLKRLPVAIMGTPGDVIARPSNVDVLVTAPAAMLSELDPEHFVPVVDVTGLVLSRGAVSAPVTVRGLSEGIRVVRIEPSEVLVRAR